MKKIIFVFALCVLLVSVQSTICMQQNKYIPCKFSCPTTRAIIMRYIPEENLNNIHFENLVSPDDRRLYRYRDLPSGAVILTERSIKCFETSVDTDSQEEQSCQFFKQISQMYLYTTVFTSLYCFACNAFK